MFKSRCRYGVGYVCELLFNKPKIFNSGMMREMLYGVLSPGLKLLYPL